MRKNYTFAVYNCLEGMDELSVIVEGIGNKVKKLILKNIQLKDRLLQAESEKAGLREKIAEQQTQIEALESQVSTLLVAGSLHNSDAVLARQKVNDLLREIEKCQVLLNR